MKPGKKSRGDKSKTSEPVTEPVTDQDPVQGSTSEATSSIRERLQEPKLPEKRFYYGNLNYKLIARTTEHEFEKDRTREFGKKEVQVSPVGKYSFFTLFWNGRGAKSLQSCLRKALEPLEIVKLEAVQIGFANEDSQDWPVTICVTIKKRSAKWATAVDAALKAKEVLVAWDLEDMECEIREDRSRA